MSPLPGWGEENGEKPLDQRKLFLEMRWSLVPAPSHRKGWASREFGLASSRSNSCLLRILWFRP